MRKNGILFTGDWHCGLTIAGKPRNDEIGDVLKELVEKAAGFSKEKNIGFSHMVITGDLTESFRYPGNVVIRQIADTLIDFRDKVAPDAVIYIIKGNHDWGELGLYESFYRDRVKFIDTPQNIQIDDRTFLSCIPYMRAHELPDGGYAKVIETLSEELPYDANKILAAHAALEGTVPNLVENQIDAKTIAAEDYRYAFLGHIHQHASLGGNVYYTGSLIRNTFGEEGESSGFYVLSDDMEIFDIPLSGGRPLINLAFDDDPSASEIESRIKEVISKNPDAYLKLKIPGGLYLSQEIKMMAKSLGISDQVVTDFSIVKTQSEEKAEDVPGDSRDLNIVSLWKDFCSEKGKPEEGALFAELGESIMSGAHGKEIWAKLLDDDYLKRFKPSPSKNEAGFSEGDPAAEEEKPKSEKPKRRAKSETRTQKKVAALETELENADMVAAAASGSPAEEYEAICQEARGILANIEIEF